MITTPTRLNAGLALGFAALVAFAGPSFAQKETQSTLRSNPYRDIGGSCVYGKQGEVLFAPKGGHCPDRTDHLSAARKATTTADPFPGLPPAYQTEARGLVSDHSHIADELDQLRQAIARSQKEDALAIADKLVGEMREHLAREEDFIGKLAAEHGTH